MTDHIMDIDDLKLAWQQIDRRLERQNTLALLQFREGRMRRLRTKLWPLYGGQTVQALFGAAIVVAGVATWSRHWDVVHLRAAGLLLHVYGVLAIVASARTLALIHRIDYAAPVIAIQRQLGELRRWYVLSGTVIGLPWWLLWMPVMMVLLALAGVDMWQRAPRMFVLGTAVGVVGLLVTGLLELAARQPRWAWLAERLNAARTGTSLRRAAAVIEEVRRFEEDAEA